MEKSVSYTHLDVYKRQESHELVAIVGDGGLRLQMFCFFREMSVKFSTFAASPPIDFLLTHRKISFFPLTKIVQYLQPHWILQIKA